MNNLLSTLYPVGSIYIGTQNSCPLATLITGSQWQRVATQVVTNVNTGVAVYGNGKTLGLTDGRANYGIYIYNPSSANVNSCSNFNASINTYASPQRGTGYTLGVVQDGNTSGLTGSLSRTNLSLNIWKRTA